MYRKQFEAAATANNWSEGEKATGLIVALRGPALELLQTIPEDQQNNYKALTASLELRFGDQHRRQLYQVQAKTRVQKSGESLQEFEAEVRRLVHLAYPGAPEDFQEQFAAQNFIDGLKDLDIQRSLRLAGFTRSSDALMRALEMEAAYNICKPRIRAVTVQDALSETEETSQPHSTNTLLQELLREMRKMGEDRRERKRGNECFRCGRTGHWKRDCRVQLRARSPSTERTTSFTGRPSMKNQENHN